MSGYYDFLRIQYEMGNLTKDRLKNCVVKKYIIAEEYKIITGKEYIE